MQLRQQCRYCNSNRLAGVKGPSTVYKTVYEAISKDYKTGELEFGEYGKVKVQHKFCMNCLKRQVIKECIYENQKPWPPIDGDAWHTEGKVSWAV